jgi:tripeptidyl-peptidase-1
MLNFAVPDVAAIALVDFIFEGEVIDFLGGVDLSTDIIASIVALLTNERIAAGKPGLGFLNPLLYQNPSAFTHMTIGTQRDWTRNLNVLNSSSSSRK